MLNKTQFEVLAALQAHTDLSQRDIARIADISLGSVNKACKQLKEMGLLSEDNRLTEKAFEVLEPYKVKNAVILAAGMATRFAPLSFERPKAMFEVRGEVLIERLIRQLQERDINDITIVVGHMKETFFYLEDDFNVRLIINPEYAHRNNHSSLWHVREQLGNSYVISSDQYFSDNIFKSYCYESYCSAVYHEGESSEQALVVDKRNRIMGLQESGENCYCLIGPAYFDKKFAQNFIRILESEYNKPETASKLWEHIFAEHTDELSCYIETVSKDSIHEFDYLSDLIAFDRDFFANVDSHILDNICDTLHCTREDVTEVKPVSAGLTNLSCLFAVNGQYYIYRHPGNGTDEIINREAEAFALKTAYELGLDTTFVFQHPKEGWKISRYLEGCTELDYNDLSQVKEALRIARILHTSGKTSPWSFDFYDEGYAIIQLLENMHYPLPKDFDRLAERAAKLAEKMRGDVTENTLCHNDFYAPNFLVKDGKMQLIDWEYAAMGDPICDIGNFVAQGSGYSVEQTLDILPYYYNRPATEQEQRHALAAVGIVGWYWYVWALYKEAMGNPVDEWLYIWYQAAKKYIKAAEERYE